MDLERGLQHARRSGGRREHQLTDSQELSERREATEIARGLRQHIHNQNALERYRCGRVGSRCSSCASRAATARRATARRADAGTSADGTSADGASADGASADGTSADGTSADGAALPRLDQPE